MMRPRVLVPLDGSPLAEAILPVVAALDPGEVIRFSAPAGSSPAEAILRAARDTGADLIALTTHGRSGFDRLVLGSVAEKVIRSASVPVLALRAGKPPDPADAPVRLFERPLVADDGSEPLFRALAMLGRLAPAGTRPLLFGVVETWDDVPPVPPREPVASPLREYLRMRAGWLEKDLLADALRARDLGLEADVKVELGRPARRIVALAESLPASLIVLGTHGRSGPSRWALGSVTEQVLRVASVPLLIAR
jgi:nucleotide-binding universal stress UspA family protein